MNTLKINRIVLGLITVLSVATLFYSCKKTPAIYNPSNSGKVFDNSKTTQSTIYGQIVKEDGSPLKDAVVKLGTSSFTTGTDGIFFFSNITSPQNATLITVSKANYFTGYRTLQIVPNKEQYTRIKMISLNTPSTVNAITGGKVNIAGGASITFPANAIVYKSNGTPYNGTVNVYAKWLDPTAKDLNEMMPGALRATDRDNIERILATFGMMGVELYDNSNTPLQIASGKKASLNFPIPSSLSSYAPATIPLWFFDATTGMWKEEGSATKQGNYYEGDVTHFSFWNCDVPSNYVNIDMTLTDNLGVPLANMLVRITNTATGSYTHGWTNSAGFVSGAVPDNATLTVEVLMSPCYTVIHTQTVNTLTVPVSLGAIAVTTPTINTATVTGTVVDCMGVPVSNGYVSINSGSTGAIVSTNASGAFNANLILCSLPATVTVNSFDISTLQGGTITSSLVPGVNNLGTLTACGTPLEFVTWSSTVGTVTTTTTIVEPNANFYANYTPSTGNLTLIEVGDSLIGSTNRIFFTFDGLDNTTGPHNLVSYSDHLDFNCLPFGVVPVTLSNYAATTGGYITGNFSGVVNGSAIPTRTITCNFNVKRD